MKTNIIKQLVYKTILLVSIISSSTIAFADTGTNDDGVYSTSQFFAQGWVIGVLAAVVALVATAILIGRNERKRMRELQ